MAALSLFSLLVQLVSYYTLVSLLYDISHPPALSSFFPLCFYDQLRDENIIRMTITWMRTLVCYLLLLLTSSFEKIAVTRVKEALKCTIFS